MTRGDEEAARCALYPDAMAWVLCNVEAIEPFPLKGQLGLFDVEIAAELIRPKKPPTQGSLF